jgi:hypothetical protein
VTRAYPFHELKYDFFKKIVEQLKNQKNIWIKGLFTETANHLELKTPIKFEINIYTKNPNQRDFRVR